jgi:hypothetical protein
MMLQKPESLVSFSVKWQDNTESLFIVSDDANYLTLSSQVSSPNHCTKCWKASDINNYQSWDGRNSYYEEEVRYRVDVTPFLLNPSTNQCELQCGLNYWSNWISSHNPASDIYDKRCTYNNCKNWNYNADDSQITAKTCNECWQDIDMSPYSSWDANYSYYEQEVIGRNPKNAFILNTSQSHCE